MKERTKDNITEDEAIVAERERKQFVKMTKSPISKLIVGLGIPTMLSMMVTSLYNLADTFFVSLIGDDAITAAASNLLALMSVIQAIGFTFGMGSGSIVSRLLGKRDREGADRVTSSSFFISGACGLLILIFGFLFLTPLMRLLGSRNPKVLFYSKQYARYILLAAPFMCMSFVMNNVLRAQGKAVLSMIGLIAGALLNVVLDPILIFTADMGITGAALATFISQVISFLILLAMFLSGKTVVRLRVRAISRKLSVYGEVLATGFPSFCRQILASLCTVFLNRAADLYGGEAAQAALGVVQKVFMLAFSVSLGIGQGYQPVLGYNYSAKRFDRVKSAYLFTLAFSTALMAVFGLVCGIFAPYVMKMFSLSEEATEIGALALRFQCVCMPLLPLNFMAGLTYQVVGNKAIAALLSTSRQGLFYIPAVLILPKLYKLRGVQLCQAVSDFFAFFFALPFTFIFFRTLKKEQQKCADTIEE
ncbi:MAG: MATE family efflux transporter [Clostridia bacterium]|nr:MATE family efflux transporter [Clostridia bacterium]